MQGGSFNMKGIVQFSLCLALLLSGQLSGTTVIEELKQGNQEYRKNSELTKERRALLAKNQKPIATVLACSDSRVPPEIIFNKGSGDLFIVRIAGNTVDQLTLATLEYGVEYLGTPLLVILGHQHCGAIEAAFELENTNFGSNIGSLLAQIHPSIREVKSRYKDRPRKEQIELAIKENLHHTRREILFRSQVIREMVENNKLQIQEAVYNIDTGTVDWQ
jgi:carbonic anhydrase